MIDDERGVSTTLSYVLTLTITTLLLTGLVLATGTYVEGQREQIVRSQMEVVGQQVAATIESADYLASTRGNVAGTSSTVRTSRTLPERVARTGYVIDVTSTPEVIVRAETGNLNVTISIPIVIDHSIQPTSIQGGNIVVEYDESDSRLEVRSDV